MLTYPSCEGNVLKVEAKGVLTRADYQEFTHRLESLAEECGKIRVLFELKDFTGLDAASAWNGSASRLRDKNLVARFAIIGKENQRRWTQPLAEPFVEVKFFPRSHREEACRWLAEGIESDEEDRIRRRAYAKWEAAGRPLSDGVTFWVEAEHELHQAK